MMFPREFDYANRKRKLLSERERRNIERRNKLQALINDSASTDCEKAEAKRALERISE
jgi:hypothetical protein